MTFSSDMRRRVIAPLVLLISTIALAGCKVELNTTVNVADNGSGTITVTALADAEVAQRAPELGESLNLDDLRAAGWNVEVQNPAPDGGLSIVAQRPFANTDEAGFFLAQISGEDGPLRGLTLTRTGRLNDATYTITGSGGLPKGLAGFADAEALAILGSSPFDQTLVRSGLALSEALTMSLRITLPGKVLTTDGVVAPRADDDVTSTISWDIPVDGLTTDINASTRDSDLSALAADIASRVLLVVLILLVVAALLYVATVVHRRNQSTPAS